MILRPDEVAAFIIKALDNKKAQEIKLLKIANLSILADYFVICTATSTTHLKTLSDEIEKTLKDNGEPPLHREGRRAGGWVLIDCGCVVAHLFLKELRDFYMLERLWSDAEEVAI